MKKKLGLLLGTLAVVAIATFFWWDQREVEIRTTSASIAVGNLSAQIAGLEKQVNRFPKVLPNRQKLIALYLQRAQFLGTYDDFELARKAARQGITLQPEAAEPRSLYATVLMALHRFPEAEEALRDAQQRNLEPAQVTRLQDKLNLAWGKTSVAIEARRQAAAKAHPSYTTLSGLASVKRRLGKFSEADRVYRRALKSYTDVSPFAVAWIHFQRGVMWAEEAGDGPRGLKNYERALKVLPQYVVANVHAAEMIWENGDPNRAISLLRSVLGGDPEPAGLLGEVLLDQNKPEEARALIAQAKNRYQTLLSRHREAFSDHGAEFFMGPGNNPTLAWDLARENLELRPQSRSFLVALQAATAAGLEGTACEVAERAKSLPFPTPVLLTELEERRGPCQKRLGE